MSSGNVDQLALNGAFVGQTTSQGMPSCGYKPVARAPKGYAEHYRGGFIGEADWPLFSLQPSMNRVAFVLLLSAFNESAEWQFGDSARNPLYSEYAFAREWTAMGGRKATLDIPAAARTYGHVSTY